MKWSLSVGTGQSRLKGGGERNGFTSLKIGGTFEEKCLVLFYFIDFN